MLLIALVWHIMKFSKIGPGLSVAIDECYIDDDNMVMLKVQTSKTHLFRNCPMYTYLCKHYYIWRLRCGFEYALEDCCLFMSVEQVLRFKTGKFLARISQIHNQRN